MYVVNIFKDNTVNQGLTTQYKYTGNYIKFKSLIGSCSGTTGDTFRLVSERWEDCIPKISDQVAGFNGYDTLKRFVYVQELNSDKYKRWMNVTFESSSTVTTLLTNLAAAGTAGMSAAALGLDQHEPGMPMSKEMAMRKLSPEWERNANFLYLD